MLYFYQHLPEFLSPIAFAIGNFEIRWYSLMYLVGFLVVYVLLKRQLTNANLILDFLIYSFIGLIVGARLGYVFFYDFEYFRMDPLAVISPFDLEGNFTGIFGMSYHGGLVGVILSSIVFSKIYKVNFFEWTDFVIPAIPLGYFFGRIGNFLNGELYGKVTSHFWGMYFGDGILRHPTQLYEAFLEGILLFLILWPIRTKSKFPGNLLAIYLFGYGVVRFFVEFLRETDEKLLYSFTIGQWLSILMIFGSVIIFFWLKNSKFGEKPS